MNYVIGLHPIYELLQTSAERIIKVYLQKSSFSARKEALIQALKVKKIPIEYLSFEALTRMGKSDSHQGFVAEIIERKLLDVETFMKTAPKEALVVALDSIYDPHNFGAILRACECFGASAILWSKNRGCGITPAVTKASAGASELVNLILVANLATTLKKLQEEGFSLIAAEANRSAISLSKFSFPARSVLILGSEGEGIQKLILKMCDHNLYIPMQGKIGSLNVSQAASVLLATYTNRQR